MLYHDIKTFLALSDAMANYFDPHDCTSQLYELRVCEDYTSGIAEPTYGYVPSDFQQLVEAVDPRCEQDLDYLWDQVGNKADAEQHQIEQDGLRDHEEAYNNQY